MPAPGYAKTVAKGRARRFWLAMMIVALVVGAYGVAGATATLSRQDNLDRLCADPDPEVFLSGWRNCSKAADNEEATSVFAYIGAAAFGFALVSLVLWRTRDKYREVVVAVDSPEDRRPARARERPRSGSGAERPGG